MKIIAHIQKHAHDPDYKLNDQIQELFLVLVGQIRYIQEEDIALVIVGSYGDNAHSIYRNILKNTSAYNPVSVEALKNLQSHWQHYQTLSQGIDFGEIISIGEVISQPQDLTPCTVGAEVEVSKVTKIISPQAFNQGR